MKETEQSHERRVFRIVCRTQNLLGARPLVKADLLWPCDAWDVTFPAAPQMALDVFADTVLKLANHGVSPKADPYPVGMEPELLRLVREHLVMQGMLDAQLHVTPEGKQYLGEDGGKEAAYETGTVFTDCCTGQLLPFVLNGQPVYSRGTPDDEGRMSFKASPTDADKRLARIFEPSRPLEESVRPPTPLDVYRVLKLHRRKCSRMRIQESSALAPPKIPAVGTVAVGCRPERVYLACTLLVPAGNEQETLVTDGFGLGFSAAFCNALKRENPAWWREERQKTVVSKLPKPVSRKPEEQLLYPNVTKLLRSVNRHYQELLQPKEIDTAAANKRRDSMAAVVNGAYDAIEQALAYYVAGHVPDAVVNMLMEMDMQAKPRHILNCAKRLGLDTVPAKAFFDWMPPGKYRELRKGAEMAPLLSLAIVSAEADRTQPMAMLADKEPGMLGRIARMAPLRNAGKHSAGEMPLQQLGAQDRKSQETALDGIRRFALQVACTLLPDIMPELGRGVVKADSELTDALESHLFLEEKFPYGFSNGIPRQLWDCLQAAARSWVPLKRDPDNPQLQNTYVVNLCSAVEKTLEHACRSYSAKPAPDTGAAARRMVETGFYPDMDAVPLGALGGHNNSRLSRVLDGGPGTLGSYAMALFLLARSEELEQLRRAVPDAVGQIVRIGGLRGHGNNPGGHPAETLEKLDAIYPLIRKLGQIFIIS